MLYREKILCTVFQTRILVTNALQYLPVMDKIIVMKNGVILEAGTYQELILNQGSELARMVKDLNGDDSNGKGENTFYFHKACKLSKTLVM